MLLHNISHLEDEAFADPAGGVIAGVLLLGQIPGLHERDRDGVAENHLNGGGGDRSQIEGAELPLEGQVHVHVANGGEGIAVDGGDRDQISPLGLGAGDEPEELVGVAGLAKEDEDIARGENANVAVEGVDGGEEGGGDGEGDESLGDLAGDEAGLADAGEEDGAAGVEEGAGEGKGLGEVEVAEEEVEVVLLGLEEVEECGLVNGGMGLGLGLLGRGMREVEVR